MSGRFVRSSKYRELLLSPRSLIVVARNLTAIPVTSRSRLWAVDTKGTVLSVKCKPEIVGIVLTIQTGPMLR